jgi:AraC-type DNA-binding domain-containing proteins
MDSSETTLTAEVSPARSRRPVPELLVLPRPVYARVEDIPRRAVTRAHSHAWIQLSYASRGLLQIRTVQGLFVAPPQWAIIVPPGVEHTVVNSPDTEMRSLYIDNSALLVGSASCQVVAVSPLLREMIRHFSTLPALYDESGADGRLVDVMLDQIASATREEFSLPWPGDPGLYALCTAILQDPSRPLRVKEWSEGLKVSERTLERMFTRQTGLSMRQWRLRARLLGALPLLQRGETVTDVALSCGYESTSSFIAAFRQFFGVTPGLFARSPD